MPVTCTEPPTFPQTRPSHPTRPSQAQPAAQRVHRGPRKRSRPPRTPGLTLALAPTSSRPLRATSSASRASLSPCSPPQSSSPHWTGGESEERRESPNARARRALFWCREFARTEADRQVYHLEGRGWRRPGPPESQEKGGQHWSRADVHVWN